MDSVSYRALTQAGKYDGMMPESFAYTYGPSKTMSRRYSKQFPVNLTFNNDPVFDKMYEQFAASTDEAVRKKLSIEADMYIIAHHWVANASRYYNFALYQPYLKGYSGEYQLFSAGNWGFFISRFWIDQNLKKTFRR